LAPFGALVLVLFDRVPSQPTQRMVGFTPAYGPPRAPTSKCGRVAPDAFIA
jgi:hypothetical protein